MGQTFSTPSPYSCTLALKGKCHEHKASTGKTRSFASVEATAIHSKAAHDVFYEIKWTSASVTPDNPHLNQTLVNAYQEDKSAEGRSITRNDGSPQALHNFQNNADGTTTFYFRDGIEQDYMHGGKWFFRLRIARKSDGATVAQDEVEIDWDAASINEV